MDIANWTKIEFEELLRDFIRKSLPPNIGFLRVKFEFYLKEKPLFEYSPSNNELNIKTDNQEEVSNIVNCLDRSGLIEIDSTLMLSSVQGAFPHKSTGYFDWADWFLGYSSLYDYIIIDTNIIMNHYCSNLLFPKLKQRFESLKIKIPRLTILEIERIANEKESVKKRLGLFATTEVMFLKNHKAELLPSLSYPLLTSFNEKSGGRKVDSWIRQEVHDFVSEDLDVVRTGKPWQVLFMTCDIANGLAAYSEGLNTCIFSKCEQEKLIIPTSFNGANDLAEFILNVSITFEKIIMKVYVDGKTLSNSYQIEGIWSGKTPYHWLNHCLRLQEIT